MAKKSIRAVISETLASEMQRDPRIILIGEDVSGGAGGTGETEDAFGGAFGIYKGLAKKFGRDRVIDTPISEAAFIGAAAGAACAGADSPPPFADTNASTSASETSPSVRMAISEPTE